MIKRWLSGVVSRVDWMVSQVEDHEALINNALQKAREGTARTKVQLGRIQKDTTKLRHQLSEEKNAVLGWRERAKKIARENEERALECLRRSKKAERRVEQITARVTENECIERKIALDISNMEEQLKELAEKRNLIRTRQSSANAASIIQGSSELVDNELDDVFERWESRVTEKEMASEYSATIDLLETDFLEAEEVESLRSELKELTETDNQ